MSYTLNTVDRPAVYAVDQGGGKSGANVTEGIAPTLTCTHGGEPAIAIENHPNDSRVKFSEGNIVQALTGRMGTGGAIPQWCLIDSQGGGKTP